MWTAYEPCHVDLELRTYYIKRATVAVLMQICGKMYFRFHTSVLTNLCAVNQTCGVWCAA
jgi:hypothetical protein